MHKETEYFYPELVTAPTGKKYMRRIEPWGIGFRFYDGEDVGEAYDMVQFTFLDEKITLTEGIMESIIENYQKALKQRNERGN